MGLDLLLIKLVLGSGNLKKKDKKKDRGSGKIPSCASSIKYVVIPDSKYVKKNFVCSPSPTPHVCLSGIKSKINGNKIGIHFKFNLHSIPVFLNILFAVSKFIISKKLNRVCLSTCSN